MPAVSVIVPVYKVEPFVARCVRSLFVQSLADMEFIFIDDCTPDRSMEVIREVLEREFPAREPQVRFFNMPENSGQAKVRMQGLALATGEYVIHCDSDDELSSPDAYRLLYEKAVSGQLDIVTCNYLKEEPSGRRVLVKEECKGVSDLLLDKVQGSLVCRLIRRALLQEGLLAPQGNMGEDLVLALQATLRAQSSGHIDEPFYLYKQVPGQGIRHPAAPGPDGQCPDARRPADGLLRLSGKRPRNRLLQVLRPALHRTLCGGQGLLSTVAGNLPGGGCEAARESLSVT